MTKERRATFAKVLIENGADAKTVYSFRLERIHWIFGILASIAAIAVALVVLRGAVYASVQDVAGDEFRNQLDRFHAEAQPAIRALIDERIEHAAIYYMAQADAKDFEAESKAAKTLGEIAETLARLDERLAGIERRLDRQERGGS
jgi:hypothetical protein